MGAGWQERRWGRAGGKGFNNGRGPGGAGGKGSGMRRGRGRGGGSGRGTLFVESSVAAYTIELYTIVGADPDAVNVKTMEMITIIEV